MKKNVIVEITEWLRKKRILLWTVLILSLLGWLLIQAFTNEASQMETQTISIFEKIQFCGNHYYDLNITYPQWVPLGENETPPYINLNVNNLASVDSMIKICSKDDDVRVSFTEGTEKHWRECVIVNFVDEPHSNVYFLLPFRFSPKIAEYQFEIIEINEYISGNYLMKTSIIIKQGGFWRGLFSNIKNIGDALLLPFFLSFSGLMYTWVSNEEKVRREKLNTELPRIAELRKVFPPQEKLKQIMDLYSQEIRTGNYEKLSEKRFYEEVRNTFSSQKILADIGNYIAQEVEPLKKLTELIELCENKEVNKKDIVDEIKKQFIKDPKLSENKDYSTEDYLYFITNSEHMEYNLWDIYVSLIVKAWEVNSKTTLEFLDRENENINKYISALFIDYRLSTIKKGLTAPPLLNTADQIQSELEYWEIHVPWMCFPTENQGNGEKLLEDFQTPYALTRNGNDDPDNWASPTKENIETNSLFACPLDWDAKWCIRKYSSEIKTDTKIINETFVVFIPFSIMQVTDECSIPQVLFDALAQTWMGLLLNNPFSLKSLHEDGQQLILAKLLLLKYGSQHNVMNMITQEEQLIIAKVTQEKAAETSKKDEKNKQGDDSNQKESNEKSLDKILSRFSYLKFRLTELFIKLENIQDPSNNELDHSLSLRPGGFSRTIFLFSPPDQSVKPLDLEAFKNHIRSFITFFDEHRNDKIFSKWFLAKKYAPTIPAHSYFVEHKISWETEKLQIILETRLSGDYLQNLVFDLELRNTIYGIIEEAKPKWALYANGSYGRMIKQLRRAFEESRFLEIIKLEEEYLQNNKDLEDKTEELEAKDKKKKLTEDLKKQAITYLKNHYTTDQFEDE